MMEDNGQVATVTCDIGNPLPGPNEVLNVITTIIPRAGLVGNEAAFMLNFSVASVNPEDARNTSDNMITGNVQAAAVADVTLDELG